MEFDFVEHCLRVRVSDGRSASLPLEPQSVAAFYRRFMQTHALEVPVAIRTTPNELPDLRPARARASGRRSSPPGLGGARRVFPRVSSDGFWAGSDQHPYAMFYSRLS